jgi:hypothetical protein
MILSPLQVSIMRAANANGGAFDTSGNGFLRSGEVADLEAQGFVEPVKDRPGWYSVTSAGQLELAATIL